MFGLFKKDPLKKLQEKRKKLLKLAFEYSHIDRTKSDAYNLEAEKVLEEIESLKANQ
ncbi:MAG: Lacal_2735 family protein [Flavobacteriales bacterium]|nr:Lacal_2735 family protein [Flavobacteriales bacterium]